MNTPSITAFYNSGFTAVDSIALIIAIVTAIRKFAMKLIFNNFHVANQFVTRINQSARRNYLGRIMLIREV